MLIESKSKMAALLKGALRLFLVFLVLSPAAISSCQKSPGQPVPESMILDVTFWNTVLRDYMLAPYDYPGESVLNKPTGYSAEEQTMLKKMITDNWEYNVKYNATKAVAVVDLSKTGVVEWVNVNKNGFPVDFRIASKNKRFYAFEFKDGKWWYAAPYIPRDWSGFDEERNEWDALNLPIP